MKKVECVVCKRNIPIAEAKMFGTLTDYGWQDTYFCSIEHAIQHLFNAPVRANGFIESCLEYGR